MPITHPYVSLQPDSGNDDEVSADEWNAAHTLPAHDELSGLTDDDHTQYLKEKAAGGTAAEVPAHDHSEAAEAGTVSHDDLTGISGDNHHDESHAHDGADGSGTVAHSDLTGTTADDHHNQAHAINGADHTGTLDDSQIPSSIARDSEVATAVSDHATATDPHTGYRREDEDHSHQSTGAQAGQLDHGAALTGLTDDDHTIYLKEKASGGIAAEVPEHDHSGTSEGGHPSSPTLFNWWWHWPIILNAHRGDINPTDGYPENTLPAFIQAATRGAHVAKADVQLSSDGTWYLMHDTTVNRTTDGSGTIASKTDAQIDALTIDGGLGYNASRHASLNLAPPTLESVLDAIRPFDMTLQLQCKNGASETTLLNYLITKDWHRRSYYGGTTQGVAQALKAIDPYFVVMGITDFAEADIVEGEFDSVVAADISNARPKPFSVYVDAANYGSFDEATGLSDVFDLQARVYTTMSLSVALSKWRELLGFGETTSSNPGGGAIEISFGSEPTSGQAETNSSGGEAFVTFGNITRLVGAEKYSFDPLRVAFEVNLKTSDDTLDAKARLFDITDGSVVAGSTVVTDSEDATRLRSSYITLDDEEHEYRAEFGGADTGTATIYGARLLIGDNTMVSEGSDNEVEPPPAVSGVTDDMANEFKNFPSLEGADDAQPEWWEEADGNATLTEVDLAGEGITEKYERALKLIVATAPSYAYQEFTYANEPRLKAGKTYSVAVDCWAVGSAEAFIRMQSSVGSLGVSGSTSAAAWTTLTVEGIAIDGTTLQIRLEGAVGTFYFVPLGLVEGVEAPTTQLRPRSLRYHNTESTQIEDLAGSDGEAWADVDLTSLTSPNAVMALLKFWAFEGTAGEEYYYATRFNGSSNDTKNLVVKANVAGDREEHVTPQWVEWLDDGQIFERKFVRQTGAGTVAQAELVLDGYWEWE